MQKPNAATRRHILAGLGTLATVAPVAAAPALAGTDPIFAAIEAHKVAWAAYGEAISAACEVEEAGEASWAAWHAMLATRPATLAGLLAFVNYAAHYDGARALKRTRQRFSPPLRRRSRGS